MTHNPVRSRRRRLGAHTVEFALTLPAFVFIMAAMFDFGWLFYQQAMLDSAIHQGCRAGAVVDPEDDVPEDVATETILASMDAFGQACPDDGTALSMDDLDTNGEGERVFKTNQQCGVFMEKTGSRPAISMDCTVVKKFEPLFGLVPAPETIGANTVMRFEWQDLVDEDST